MSPPTARQLQQGMVNAALTHLSAATMAMGGDPFLNAIMHLIQHDGALPEIDKRFPIAAGTVEALATLGAMACNAWPKGEREQMAERFIATFRAKFDETQDQVDGWLATIDPIRALARAKAGGR